MKNLLFLILTICVFPAFGQNGGITIERKGFVFGLGIGGGVISIAHSHDEVSFDEAQFGISLPNLKLGWMVNERLAILGTTHGMIYNYQSEDRSFDAFIPSIQYWVNDRWWINGGIGLAVDFPAFYEADDFKEEDWNFGGAVAISTGYEMVQKKRYALDLHTKLHMGRVNLDNNETLDGVAFSIGLGFTWY